MPRLPAPIHASAAALLSLSAFAFPAWLLSLVVDLPEMSVVAQPERIATLQLMGETDKKDGAPSKDNDGPTDAIDAIDAIDSIDAIDAIDGEPVADNETPATQNEESHPAAANPKAPQHLAGLAIPAQEFEATDRPTDLRARVKERHAAAAAARSAMALTTRKKKSRKCIERDNPDISEVAEGQFNVARSLVDYYTDDLKEAARLAAVAWHLNDEGKVDGFRIRRIRCGSVLHEAGLRNGDIIHKVNGRPVKNIPQALLAYRKLRKKRTLRLDLTRKGAELDLRYRLS